MAQRAIEYKTLCCLNFQNHYFVTDTFNCVNEWGGKRYVKTPYAGNKMNCWIVARKFLPKTKCFRLSKYKTCIKPVF